MIALVVLFVATRSLSDFATQPYSTVVHPDWSRDAVIYQINTRQFTDEGTFHAAIEHL